MDPAHIYRLWHQLSKKLKELQKEPLVISSGVYLDLYVNFISSFKDSVNPLELAQMAVFASLQVADYNEAYHFLESEVSYFVGQKSPSEGNALDIVVEATYLLRIQLGIVAMRMGETAKAKAAHAEAKSSLKSTFAPVTQSKAYEFSMEYFKAMNLATEYFNAAMLYLCFVDLEDIPDSRKSSLACDLCVAALLGDSIYSFGELLQQPLLQILKDSNLNWMVEMLSCFNHGRINRFETLLHDNLTFSDALASNVAFLRHKVRLLALVNMVFNRKSGERVLKFDDIYRGCQIDENEVELLLIKALSLNLIQGRIDQVSKQCYIHHVQPRVLEKSQLMKLKKGLSDWVGKVDHSIHFLETAEPELLADEFLI